MTDPSNHESDPTGGWSIREKIIELIGYTAILLTLLGIFLKIVFF